ncbi:MAG: MBL fold metallo-hydrolase [Phycisphaeraceae bacterium]|nr:MBL fold metallo-hydrolase [Phycisphaerales bacterium]QOJ16906.1 MAG: MBL fold metallo-hydrolase [Phycisphaeraceae bacterium]
MTTPPPRPIIHTFVLGDYQTNCFVVEAPPSRDCWIVDCGQEPEELIDFIRSRGLKPVALLLTHAHLDHIAGIDIARRALGPMPMFIHRAEAGFCSDPMANLSILTGRPVSVTEPENLLSGGETLQLAGTRWRVLHTPGHSPGGVCYIHDDSRQALVGDTLFAGSIGRFDFPTSDPDALRTSILETIMSLPDDMTVHPGHGPATTIGRERKTNPYVRGGW